MVTAALSLSAVGVACGDFGEVEPSELTLRVGDYEFVGLMASQEIIALVAVHMSHDGAEDLPEVLLYEHQEQGGWTTSQWEGDGSRMAIACLKEQYGIGDQFDIVWQVLPAGTSGVTLVPGERSDGQSGDDDPVRKINPGTTGRTFDYESLCSWSASSASAFSGLPCEEHIYLSRLSEIMNLKSSDLHPVSVYREDGNVSVGQWCEKEWDLNPPVLDLVFMDDQPLVSPDGEEYFLPGDSVFVHVQGFDRDRADIDVDITLNGEPLLPGLPITGTGLHWLTASTTDDFGNVIEQTRSVNIRPREQLNAEAWILREEVTGARGQVPTHEFEIGIRSDLFHPMEVRISSIRLGVYDQQVGVRFLEGIAGMWSADSNVPDLENSEYGISDDGITAIFRVDGEVPEGTSLMVTGIGMVGNQEFDFFLTPYVWDGIENDFPLSGHRPPFYIGFEGPPSECVPSQLEVKDMRDQHKETGHEYKRNPPNPPPFAENNTCSKGWSVIDHVAKNDTLSLALSVTNLQRINRGFHICLLDRPVNMGIHTHSWALEDAGGPRDHLSHAKTYVFETPCINPECEALTFASTTEGTFSLRSNIEWYDTFLSFSEHAIAGCSGSLIIQGNVPLREAIEVRSPTASGSVGISLSWPPGTAVGWNWTIDPFAPVGNTRAAQANPHAPEVTVASASNGLGTVSVSCTNALMTGAASGIDADSPNAYQTRARSMITNWKAIVTGEFIMNHAESCSIAIKDLP